MWPDRQRITSSAPISRTLNSERLNTRKLHHSSWTISFRSRSLTTTTTIPYRSGRPVEVSKGKWNGYPLALRSVFSYSHLVQIDVIKANDFIRLAPSVPGAKGHIWSTIPNPYEEWEVNLQMKIVGQHIGGGRGMAFWYTKEANQDGPIFGSKDKWKGLGIWFDSSSPKVASSRLVRVNAHS